MADDTQGNYTTDNNVYYAAVKLIITNPGQQNEKRFVTLPKYYANFDEDAFDKDAATDTGAGLSGAVRKIEFKNESIKSGLKIKKTVQNAPEDADDVFEFTVTLKAPKVDDVTGEKVTDEEGNIVYEPVSGEFPIMGVTEIEGTYVSRDASGKMTVRFTNGTAKIKLKGDQNADIAELPDGDLYTAAETGVLPEGVTLTSPAKDAEGKQIISGTISSTSTALAEFVNTYAATGKGEIKVQKTLTGRNWKDGDTFTFTLTGVSAPEGVKDVPMPAETEVTISNADTSKVKSFGEITFSKAGTYTYTVQESQGSISGMTYDTTAHTVTIKVKDDGNGKLIADGTELIQTINVYNEYESIGQIDLDVTKKLVGRPIADKQFEFELYYYQPMIKLRSSNADLYSDWVPTGSVKCDNTGKATFSHDDEIFKDVLTFTQNDITERNEDGTGTGTKEFRVAEVIPDNAVNADGIKYEDATPVQKDAGGFKLNGYTYDSSIKSITVNLLDDGIGHITATVADDSDELEFTNTYAAEGEIVLHAQKKLSGARKLEEGQFTFIISVC